jgi:hypothetical protein
VRPNAPSAPITKPMDVIVNALRITTSLTRDGGAPSAMRTPISRVLRLTAYDSTP